MKDRLVSGGLAGLVGAGVQNGYSFLMQALNLAEYTYSDFATMVMTGTLYRGPLGLLAGFLAYLAVGMILGVFFTWLIETTTDRYLYIKGLLYGYALWFLLTGFGNIFGLPAFDQLSVISALSILAGGLIYGLVTARVLKWVHRSYN
jgi:hypothetical protein